MSVDNTGRWPNALRSLRHRNFRLFWLGQVVSLNGTTMQLLAMGWLVYRLTESTFLLGAVTFSSLIPALPASLYGGIIADRYPRRSIILVTQTVLALQAIVLALLAWIGIINIWHVLLLGFVFGIAAALEQPARLAFFLDTVGDDDLNNAIALDSSIYNSAAITGSAIAGILVATVGEAGVFAVNAGTYLTTIVALLMMRPPFAQPTSDKQPMAGSLLDGFRYMLKQRTILMLLLIIGLAGFLNLPLIHLMPAYADLLGGDARTLGWLLTAVGIGAVIGALGGGLLRTGTRGRWMTIGNVVMPVLLLAFLAAQSLTWALILIVPLAISNTVRNLLAFTLLQVEVDPAYHGRVTSIYALLFNGMPRAGALVLGGIAELVGLRMALAGGAVLTLIWAIGLVIAMPQLTKMS